MGESVFVRELGGPEVLRVESHDPGAPGPGAVRVRTSAIGVNFIDTYHRTGAYPRPLPFVLGLEGAGTVESTGEGVSGVHPGEHVAWAGVQGSYAEAVLAPAEKIVPVPEGVTDEVAAAVMLQGMTAHYLVHATRETKPGDSVLVHAAAGGVGLLLIQVLKMAGARIIGTCSTPEKAELATEAGADEIVRYTQDDFVEAARRFTDGRGVDVVYDSVGQATFEGSLRSLRPRGMLVAFGQSSGAVPPFDVLRLSKLGSLYLTRPTIVNYTSDRAELELRAGAVLGWVASGRVRVRIGARFPLAEAATAHRALEGRQTTGKVLLLP